VGATFLGRSATTVAAPPDDQAGKRITVTASVDTGDSVYVRAKQVPGPFTVPPGYRATDFHYSFSDLSSGYQSEKLRAGNIRAIRGFVGANVGEQDFSLGPGEFAFVVGGMPGASGSLSFSLVRAEDPAGGKEFNDRERVIDVVTWSQQYPQYKSASVYYVRDGKVRGELDYRQEYSSEVHFKAEPMHIRGTFEGTMAGNVITGTWRDETLPHHLSWSADVGHPAYERIDSGKTTMETRIVLYADGTLSATCKGSGTTILDWGPTAPKDVAGKRETIPFDFAVPGEVHTSPLTGTWKNRN
jgi:hypothetical protein